MVQIVPVRNEVRATPISGQKQVASGVAMGAARELGQAGQRLGGAMADAAEKWDARRALQDEATAMELDSKFSDEAREVEKRLLAAQGGDALRADPEVRQAFTQLRERYAGMAQNDRQRSMLGRVLDRREERFAATADAHVTRQTEVYHDSAEVGRMAALSRDLVMVPDGPERMELMQGLRATVDARVRRKGLDPSAADAMFLEQASGVHQATLATLLEGPDPHAAKQYLDRWSPQIDPTVLPRLKEAVRTQVDTFDAIQFWDRNPLPSGEAVATVETPEGARETVTFAAPVAGRLSSGFGRRASPGGVGSTNHQGQDVAVPPRTPITATAPGVVRWKNDADGYGRYAVIDHGNGYETRLAHLSAAVARDGQRVEQGDVIGLSGGVPGSDGAGNSQGAHLHYEIRRNGVAVNPATVVGRQATVAPGSARAAAPMPPSLEDVYERADSEAGNDWRRREVFRREGLQRYSQERSIRQDRESEAERELQDYLPGGAKEASSSAAIPRDLWNRLSPADRRAAENTYKAMAEGEGGIDPAVANETYNDLLDLAATDRNAFIALGEFTQYRGILPENQISSLRTQRRSLVTGGPAAEDALKGMTGTINAYARSVAGINIGNSRTAEDVEELARLRGSLQQSVEGWMALNPGKAPSEEQIRGMLRVITAPTRDGALYQNGGSTNDIAVPNEARRRIVAQLARSNPPIRRPTDAQIRLAYRQALYAGSEVPPTRSR